MKIDFNPPSNPSLINSLDEDPLDYLERVHEFFGGFGLLWLVKAAGNVNLPTLLDLALRCGIKPSEMMTELEARLGSGLIREYTSPGKLTLYSLKGVKSEEVMEGPTGIAMEERVMAFIDTNWKDKEFTPSTVFRKLKAVGEPWNKEQVNALLEEMQTQGRVIRRRQGKYMGKSFWFLGLA